MYEVQKHVIVVVTRNVLSTTEVFPLSVFICINERNSEQTFVDVFIFVRMWFQEGTRMTLNKILFRVK